MDRPPLRTEAEARTYVVDLGFLLLFGDAKATYPSLREAARDENAAMLPAGWGEDLELVWTWKDQFPMVGAAWCGRFLLGRQSLLSPKMLQCLYPWGGAENDFESAELSAPASQIVRHVHDHGPSSLRSLRSIYGLDSRGTQRVLTELGRALLVTNFGTVQDGPGWPSGVIELTSRVFTFEPRPPQIGREKLAATKFVDVMVETDERALARALRWSRPMATRCLDGLVDDGVLTRTSRGVTVT